MSEKLVAPTAHLNGTSKAELESQLLSVLEHTEPLLAALYAASPNLRDYYVQEDGTQRFRIACCHHEERIRAVHAISEDIMQILARVLDPVANFRTGKSLNLAKE